MSLFDDDFYSTKTSKNRPWREKGWQRSRRFAGKKLNMAVVSGLGGALLMLLFVGLAGAIKDDRPSGVAPVAAVTSVSGDAQQMNSDSVVRAADRIKPAVVSVVSTRQSEKGEPNALGIGSGVIFQKSGDKLRIVTNNHVVDGSTEFEIVQFQGERRKATLIGKDTITDLAVLEMDASGMKTVAEFGDSDKLQAGETAIAVGNPLGLGFSPTVTKGIISSPLRTIPVSLGQQGDFDWEMEVIQTDAAINQGNSGGPLVNLEGKVIGINSLKIADMGVEGLGFAIPINDVLPILESLIKDHKVKRPLMGVSTQELQSFSGTDVLNLPNDVKTGIIVFEVSGPAKDAGLKTQDVITELDGRKIGSTLELRKYLYNERKIGDKVEVVFYRDGKKMTATVTLAEAGER